MMHAQLIAATFRFPMKVTIFIESRVGRNGRGKAQFSAVWY